MRSCRSQGVGQGVGQGRLVSASAGLCSRDAMHAACMWSRDAEVIMLWEGEAGTALRHGGGHAARGQLAIHSLGL